MMADHAPSELRLRILELVEAFYGEEHARPEFVPGETLVPVAGRVFEAEELLQLVDASLDFWLTTGRYARRFEREFARFFGVRTALLCNSGSSANLLALTALTSPKLGERRLEPGDEVITVAAGFPTTVNPIVQNGLVPVFVDVTLADVQHRRVAARGGALAQDAGDHDRAHARQPLRPRCGDGVRAASTASG